MNLGKSIQNFLFTHYLNQLLSQYLGFSLNRQYNNFVSSFIQNFESTKPCSPNKIIFNIPKICIQESISCTQELKRKNDEDDLYVFI